MEQRGAELRQAIERSRNGRARWRCPSGLRTEVLAFVGECRDGGATMAEVSAWLGVSDSSLQRWAAAERVDRGGGNAIRQVRVVEGAGNGGGLVLVTPRGYRIEGLTVETAAGLLLVL